MAQDGDTDKSLVQRIAELPPAQAEALRAEIGDDWRLLDGAWGMMARPSQLAPAGDWRLWLIMAGRGFGKTRAGAEWIDDYARANRNARIALIGATMRDVREVMIEGNAGILNLGSRARPPLWQPSLHKLIWAESGTIATCYSAAEPETLRGPEHHAAWADEIGRWGLDASGAGATQAWTNLQLGLRQGNHPQLGEVAVQGRAFSAELRGGSDWLEQPIVPVTSAGCRAELGDWRCGAALAGLTARRTVSAVAGQAVTVPGAPPGLAHGRLRWMSGPLRGLRAVIMAQDGDLLTLADPVIADVAAGTAVELTQGCDKRAETCRVRFANIANFRGEPHLPGTDLLTRFPGG